MCKKNKNNTVILVSSFSFKSIHKNGVVSIYNGFSIPTSNEIQENLLKSLISIQTIIEKHKKKI